MVPDHTAAPRRDEQASFLRVGAIVCVLWALFVVGEALYRGGGLTGYVVVTFDAYLFVGLAWGFVAIRPGPLFKVAAVLLLLEHALMHLALHGSHHALLEVLPWLGALATSSFVLALSWRGSARAVVVAVIALGGAVSMGATKWDGGALRVGGLVTTSLALAVLFELSRRRVSTERAASTLGAWRQAGVGARLLVMGEWARLAILLGMFMLELIMRRLEARVDLGLVMLIGFMIAQGVSVVGLVRMRRAPFGGVWLWAALGMALVALSSIAIDLLGGLLDLTEGATGWGGNVRILGLCCMAMFAARGLGALGAGAGLVDADRDARRTVWAYGLMFGLFLAMLFTRSLLVANLWLLGVLGLVLLGLLIWTIIRLARLGKRVRKALPAGAADDLFGDMHDVQK